MEQGLAVAGDPLTAMAAQRDFYQLVYGSVKNCGSRLRRCWLFSRSSCSRSSFWRWRCLQDSGLQNWFLGSAPYPIVLSDQASAGTRWERDEIVLQVFVSWFLRELDLALLDVYLETVSIGVLARRPPSGWKTEPQGETFARTHRCGMWGSCLASCIVCSLRHLLNLALCKWGGSQSTTIRQVHPNSATQTPLCPAQGTQRPSRIWFGDRPNHTS